jgi:hypothetical protein
MNWPTKKNTVFIVFPAVVGCVVVALLIKTYTNNYPNPALQPENITNINDTTDENIETESTVDRDTKCKYDFYGMQTITAASFSQQIANRLLDYVDKYPDLTEEEVKVFERYKTVSEECYQAMVDWQEFASQHWGPSDYRYDCHPKITKSFESHKLTLQYMSNNPHTFDKLTVKRNLEEINNLVSTFLQIGDGISTGLDPDREKTCPDLNLLEY